MMKFSYLTSLPSSFIVSNRVMLVTIEKGTMWPIHRQEFMMQHCEECGAELPNNALFCGRCGRKTASENELTTNLNNAPIEDIPMSPSAISMALNDSQDSASENEEEEQTQDDYIEPASSMPVDTNPEPEIQANQFLKEQPQYTQTPSVTRESHSPYDSTQKRGSQPVSKCLLFFLAGLIVVAGAVAALIGLMHMNLPGIGRSSNVLSNSSENENINPTGSSLTASICVRTTTPSTSVTNDGTVFVLFSSPGCSTVIASRANSSCLIFPDNIGATHKFIFDASNAAIDSKSYHLVFGLVDYIGPTTYNDARHISVGLSEGSTGRNFSWLYRSGSVTINNGEQSGTMDVILIAVNGGNTLHVVGDWACGRQMKNT